MTDSDRRSSCSWAGGQERNFFSDGFAVLKQFLDEDEVPAVRGLIECLLRSPVDVACTRPHNTLLPLRWNHPIVQLLLKSVDRIQGLTDAVGADDLKWISGYVSIKEACSPALWWHQDWWCWDHPVSYQGPATQIATLCYLSDTSVHSGALRVLPGSHRRSAPIHAILPEAHSEHSQGLEPGHAAMGNLGGQITPDLKAGDAVAIDYRLLHGTHPNATNARRDCVLFSFTPCWRQLPEDIRAHLVSHPAQPSFAEDPERLTGISDLLPKFAGVRRSLSLNRNAPENFAISDAVAPNR